MSNKKFNLYDLYKKNNEFLVEEDILSKFFEKYNNKNITDFHFEPLEDNVLVKIRYCGSLINLNPIDFYEYEILLNKLLINCGFDIIKDFENIDGSFTYKRENFRVSFVKSARGISCVLRKLRNISEIEVELGSEIEKKTVDLMKEKSKVLIFSGPTGSGKTTTMHYIVNKFKGQRKVHSIEDPIEYINPEIIQIVCHDENERLDILKYILRQDPELIVVGEVREKNFAKLLFESSVTGHLVFSSLHTKNVFLVLQRLKMFDIDVKNLSDSLDFLTNQRLISKNCNLCKGAGCDNCFYTGKDGFITVFEGLIVSENLKKDIAQNKSVNYIKEKYKFSEFYIDPNLKLLEALNSKIINEEEYLGNLSSFE
ncbi:ATPase, T2SS/T4P/T4SS family [Petrotoga sp. 9PWA.NaAc.5.4]|uniref:ATPase, T2SS/T4P/T4SS family n=1 Tax=Petrotoga sp. 9PWA.NaAc.5.4 TaxID=1434328 RepID=UPI000CA84D89|nr:ATPase, T2SS/T4P/T4SS family [Petrotoga sp. 9PWA.NaAc.5.4]PNR92553.1 hypothetical protein X924_09270 [Petrotoga sp. 9PWA.NaAc.5.4]